MPRDREAGLKAAATIKAKYGEDFYRIQGQLGGKVRVPKGFALMDKKRLSELGRKGGTNSRRK